MSHIDMFQKWQKQICGFKCQVSKARKFSYKESISLFLSSYFIKSEEFGETNTYFHVIAYLCSFLIYWRCKDQPRIIVRYKYGICFRKNKQTFKKKKKITSQAKEITGEEEVGNKVQKGSIPLTLDTKLEINMILFFSEHL